MSNRVKIQFRKLKTELKEMINNINKQCPLKTKVANQFPNHISRIGRTKVHIVKSKHPRHFQPKHQNVGECLSIYKTQLAPK